jgi:parvulin-like peptidyl-prolyl isomerase
MKDYLASQLSGMVDIDEPSDEEIREYYDKNYYRAKHILISFSNYETDGSDGHEEALKKAEEVKAMIDGGANFESLIPEYNEDTAINDSETGYIFTKDVMVKPFEEATKALKVGEISDIVETDYGYHIIKRLDAGAAYNEFLTSKSMLDQNGEMTGKDEIINFTKQEKLTVMIDEWKDKADIKTNDSVLKEIPLTASSEEK